MLKQVLNDGSKDSNYGTQQLKIYTDHYMMYAGPQPGDSLGSFGIGTYKIQNGKVIEHVFHTASGPGNDTFELTISKSGNNYTQVIHFPPDSGRNYVLTEDYKNVGKDVTTPLDGAWKQTKLTYIPKNGNTFTDNNVTQFKVYQSGHFIWANSFQDSASNKRAAYFGYGSFEMDGKNKSKEVVEKSTFVTDLVGKTVNLQLEFIGKDMFRQTMLHPNGDRSIEVYERMK